MILKDGLSIRGLNTAATLWCTAAIGALEAANAQPLLLHSIESENLETDGRVRVQATLMSPGHEDALLEEMVSKLGL